MLHISVGEVISIHENVINVYGGIHGVRDKGLLSSIVKVFFRHSVVMNYTLQIKIKFVGCIICLLLIKYF